MDYETTPFSHEKDDEWAADNNEDMQNGDHDKFHDIYQEDNEDHEGDAGKLLMANKLDNVDVVVGKKDEGMRNNSIGIIVCSQLGAYIHDVLNKDFEMLKRQATTRKVMSLQRQSLYLPDLINLKLLPLVRKK